MNNLMAKTYNNIIVIRSFFECDILCFFFTRFKKTQEFYQYLSYVIVVVYANK